MIRACPAAAIALVVAWNSGSLILARVDESHSRHPVTSAEARRHLPVPTNPMRLAMTRAQPTLSLSRFEPSATAFEQHGPAATPPDLALAAATAPVPRPARVTMTRPLRRPATPA